MATEKRLIEANKIYDAVERRYKVSSGIEHRCERDFLDMICSADTVDAVEVVRCKDCKFYKDSPMGGKGCHTHFNGRTEFIPKNDNDFCSYGGKKIDEQKDC